MSRKCQCSKDPSLATRLCYDFTLLYIEAATILDMDLWPTVGHLVHKIAT